MQGSGGILRSLPSICRGGLARIRNHTQSSGSCVDDSQLAPFKKNQRSTTKHRAVADGSLVNRKKAACPDMHEVVLTVVIVIDGFRINVETSALADGDCLFHEDHRPGRPGSLNLSKSRPCFGFRCRSNRNQSTVSGNNPGC